MLVKLLIYSEQQLVDFWVSLSKSIKSRSIVASNWLNDFTYAPVHVSLDSLKRSRWQSVYFVSKAHPLEIVWQVFP